MYIIFSAGINHRKNADNYAEITVSGDQDQLGNSAHLVTSVSIEKAHSSSSPNGVFLSWQPPTDPTLDVDVYEVSELFTSEMLFEYKSYENLTVRIIISNYFFRLNILKEEKRRIQVRQL